MEPVEVKAVGGKLPKTSTKAQFERLYRPYWTAIGKVTHARNHFHENLSRLFVALVTPNNFMIGLAVWNSSRADAAQREMLRSIYGMMHPKILSTEAKADIKWLLGESEKLSEARNDAIHAPLVASTSIYGSEIVPMEWAGNRRAKNLVNKDILDEFEWCRKYTEILSAYASQMWRAIHFPDDVAWPDRPRPLTRGQKQTQKGRRRSRRKPHPRLPLP